MDAGVIVAIVIGAVVLVTLLVLVGRRGRERKFEARREEAGEVRREARARDARTEKVKAEAEERAARARREQAVAEEHAVRADRESRFARERHAEADQIDPDVDEKEEGARRDREAAERSDRR